MGVAEGGAPHAHLPSLYSRLCWPGRVSARRAARPLSYERLLPLLSPMSGIAK